ncbi:LysR family transcriptional regulator [Vibrio mangrovi]|uniref:HTH-type transcriptional regulator DmlR n=1 Tax=Vibrio mangrovi TaxID=474394 RepID=A0A1Y6IT08_9VIBR|nr:LysR family transcriptional regulator [Vibrio mangrovi]MDW6003262.1 LysR family transcriptional regulator [Vibrio mangrovi]SMR99950.1 HTH-type transcriptional regulator DmlR [Vibrio mangrovi]
MMKKKDNLSGIHAFMMTAQLGSFTAAADRLCLTKSAVAKSVGRLEERLGLKLFHRSTRRLSLTPDGEFYLNRCREALDILEHAESVLTEHIEKPSGRLRIDLPAAFGRKLVLPLLLEISQRHPALSLAVTFSERFVDLIEEGIDFVVRIGELKDSSELIVRPLTTQKLVICAAPDYLQRCGVPQSLDDISHHQCILGFRSEQAVVWNLKEADGQTRRYTPPVGHEYGDGDAMLAATLAGQGLCQLPKWLIDDYLERGELVEVLAQYSGYEVPIHILWPKSSHLLPKIRYTVDCLLQEAQKGIFG